MHLAQILALPPFVRIIADSALSYWVASAPGVVMKGFLNLLARAKLIELSEDEQRSVSGEPPPAAPAPPSETLAELPVPSTSDSRRRFGRRANGARAARTRRRRRGLRGPFAFADIFAAAGVPASPYPAEKLLRLLDGLRAMDAVTRKAAVLAMDAADDNWQIRRLPARRRAEDRRARGAQTPVGGADAEPRAAVGRGRRADQGWTLDEATAAIRQQISELEQLLEREVTRAAQEATSVEAGLRAARESAARETRRIDAEIERLREIPNTFKAARRRSLTSPAIETPVGQGEDSMAQLTPAGERADLAKGLMTLIVIGAAASLAWNFGLKERFAGGSAD
jgi:hypothetical protein